MSQASDGQIVAVGSSLQVLPFASDSIRVINNGLFVARSLSLCSYTIITAFTREEETREEIKLKKFDHGILNSDLSMQITSFCMTLT